MKNGKAGRYVAPNFLTRFFQRKTGPGPVIQTESGGLKVLIVQPQFVCQSVKRLVKLVGWMSLGFIIVGLHLPLLYAQDSRLARSAARKSPPVSPLPKPVQPDIVLPDIYIAVPGTSESGKVTNDEGVVESASRNHPPVDTTALKQKLRKTEGELRSLQDERHRLIKTLEQVKTRSVKGANRSARQRTELLERPSV
jgi:hypothetical protein